MISIGRFQPARDRRGAPFGGHTSESYKQKGKSMTGSELIKALTAATAHVENFAGRGDRSVDDRTVHMTVRSIADLDTEDGTAVVEMDVDHYIAPWVIGVDLETGDVFPVPKRNGLFV